MNGLVPEPLCPYLLDFVAALFLHVAVRVVKSHMHGLAVGTDGQSVAPK